MYYLSFCRSEVQTQHNWYQQGSLSHSGLGPLSNSLGVGKPHCLVDEKLRSPFPPLLTARDYSQLLDSPYSSWPQGSTGSSHMDVYFLPHWLEHLCFPLLQLVEKTLFSKGYLEYNLSITIVSLPEGQLIWDLNYIYKALHSST